MLGATATAAVFHWSLGTVSTSSVMAALMVSIPPGWLTYVQGVQVNLLPRQHQTPIGCQKVVSQMNLLYIISSLSAKSGVECTLVLRLDFNDFLQR